MQIDQTRVPRGDILRRGHTGERSSAREARAQPLPAKEGVPEGKGQAAPSPREQLIRISGSLLYFYASRRDGATNETDAFREPDRQIRRALERLT